MISDYVIKKFTWFNPFIIHCINEFLLSYIFCITVPIRFNNTTSMLCITTITTLTFFWEYYVSFLVNNDVLASRINIRQNTCTCWVKISIGLISSLLLVDSVIEKLSVYRVWFATSHERLIISDIKWGTPNWGFGIMKLSWYNIEKSQRS